MKHNFLLFALCLLAATALSQPVSKMKMTDVVKRVNQANDTTYIVNFWATFCKPCVAEIPGFLRVADKYKNQKVKLVLVSLDLPAYYPKRIADFVAKKKWKASVAWLSETNADIFCPMIDSGWSGAIPATVIINAKSGYKKFWEGDMTEAGFEKELKTALEFKKIAKRSPKFISPMNGGQVIDYADDSKVLSARPAFTNLVSFKSKDSSVFAVKEGEVQSVITVEDIKVVIIKNGELYYTYSNLKKTFLKKGEPVTNDQLIGIAANDLENAVPSVDFYLNDAKKSIPLTKNNFLPRDKKSTLERFSPMIGIEPE